MTSRHLSRLGLAGAVLLALFAIGCAAVRNDELVIGEYGSLTGNDATFGISTQRGVEVALDELIAKKEGKIGGLKVRVERGAPETRVGRR